MASHHTPFTGQPLKGVFSLEIVMNIKRKQLNYYKSNKEGLYSFGFNFSLK